MLLQCLAWRETLAGLGLGCWRRVKATAARRRAWAWTRGLRCSALQVQSLLLSEH